MPDNSRRNWASVDWKTGRANWEKEWFTKESVISADDSLYFYEGKGGIAGFRYWRLNNIEL